MRAAWIAALLLLAGCTDTEGTSPTTSSPTSSTPATSVAASTSAPARPRVDPLQVAGAWTVSEAGAAALYPVGTTITFAGDGSFTAGTRSGTWRVRDAELDLFTGPTMYGYAVTASPRELRLGTGPVGMTLVRA